MTFSKPGLKFSAKPAEQANDPSGSDFCSYRIEVRDAGRLTRTFTGKVTKTQATRPQAERDIERWCELYPYKLPRDGGTVEIDLSSIAIA
jgi:hypothetical protein